MPRFIFESGCEKLAPGMVKGRLPAHVSAVLALLLLAAAGASAQTAPPTLGVIVNQVLALCPTVNGEVLDVQGTTLALAPQPRAGLAAVQTREPARRRVQPRPEQAVHRRASLHVPWAQRAPHHRALRAARDQGDPEG